MRTIAISSFVLCIVCILTAGSADGPTTSPERVNLVYEITGQIGSGDQTWAETAINLLKRSLNAGDAEVTFRPIGDDRVEVRCPASQPDGRWDAKKIKKFLADPPRLAFHIAAVKDDLPDQARWALLAGLKDGLKVAGGKYAWFEVPAEGIAKLENVIVGHRGTKDYVLGWITAEKSMVQSPEAKWRLRSASASLDIWDSPCISFGLDDAGGELFGKLTGGNLHEPMMAVLDGKAISVATIQSKITVAAVITGNFSKEETQRLAATLQLGTLATGLKLVAESKAD